jgi:hypothetical protein
MNTPTDSFRHEPGPGQRQVPSNSVGQTASGQHVARQRSHADDGAPGGQSSSTGADNFTSGAQPVPHHPKEDDGPSLLAGRLRPAGTHGWRKLVYNITGGRINPGPSAKQQQAAELISRIRASLDDVHKVAFVCSKGGVGTFVCSKGGVGKSTMTVAVGNVIARARGDRVIAVDVDPDLGDLSARFSDRGGPQANIEHLASLRNADRYSNVRATPQVCVGSLGCRPPRQR